MYKVRIYYRSFDPYYESIDREFFGSSERECWDTINLFENDLSSRLPGGMINNFYTPEIITQNYI